jgi:hypothetical protein
MLVSSRCTEEIDLSAGRKHQPVTLISLSVFGVHSSCEEVGRDYLSKLDVHIRVIPEDRSQRKRRVARGQDRSCHLVQQWLELLVVVLVD